MPADIQPVGVRARGFSFRHLGRQHAVLSDLSFDIEPGERILLQGNSGSGKSTLLAAIAGVLGGDDEGERSGQLYVYREGSASPSDDIPVGLVLQDPDSQVIAARVGDDIAFGCENLGIERAEIWRRVAEAMELVGLDVPLNHPTEALSGGQKQRLALAGVLAMGAGLIILDEPTANLDPQGTADIIAAVDRVVQRTGATLIVVEHNFNGWERLLDRALVIDQGRLIKDESASETMAAIRAQREHAIARWRTPAQRTAQDHAPAALWCRDLRSVYGPPRSVDIPTGASTVITGPNGAGKTTWLMTMGGLLAPQSGEIGMSAEIARGLAAQPIKWTSRQLAQRLGFVFQNPEHQFVARSVAEELAVGPKVMGLDISSQRIDDIAQRLRLDHLMTANPFTLSGGEKRRLSVATALIATPQVLLCDEPTFGQDPHTFIELIELLAQQRDAGVTIVSVSHDELFLHALGDHHVVFSATSAQE